MPPSPPAAFRTSYLRYDELVAQLEAWTRDFPGVARVTSLGTTAEGRAIPMLTIGRDPDRARPAVLIDANMHASELAGSSVALAIAEDALRAHTGEAHELPARLREVLAEVLFYVVPRTSPDGAEAVLRDGRYVRSLPADDRCEREHARWVAKDMDGDGLALLMRVRDDTGEYVESGDFPGLLVPRAIDDDGPAYKIYPEGIIEGFDGAHVPSPGFLSDNHPDLNRNFPWGWAPEHLQVGGGSYPGSAPESRALIELSARTPHLFAWLNLHTFGGVFIRPLGDAKDALMEPSDLALFRQIAEWAETFTGYPMVSGFEEFTYREDEPLRGDLTDYAFHARGCISYVCELWDLFAQLGMKRPQRFVDFYTHFTRDDFVRLARWDRDTNHSRVIRPWRKIVHPQLGEAEVGGLDPRVGLWNPPYEKLDEMCRRQSSAFLRVAAMAPRLRVRSETRAVSGEARHVSLVVENLGYLPTHVLESAKKLPWNEALYVEAIATGCELVGTTRRMIGHLDGYGRGLFDGSAALYYQRSRGTEARRVETFVATGKGTVRFRAGSCRTGFVEHTVEIA